MISDDALIRIRVIPSNDFFWNEIFPFPFFLSSSFPLYFPSSTSS